MVQKKYSLREVKKFAREFVAYVAGERGVRVRDAFLFGSYAKGIPRDWSDVDLAIVSPDMTKDGSFTYLGTWRRQSDVVHFISPIGYHPKDFRSDDPLVREIKKYGIKIS